MIYAYKDDGRWVIASLRPRFNGIGGWHALTDKERAKHGWYPCVEVNAQFDPVTQIRSTAEFVLEDGVVTATYTIWDKPESQVYGEAATEVRNKRNQLLSESDWTQVADAPVDATAWATYRQGLRDITDHASFPNLTDEDWPTAP